MSRPSDAPANAKHATLSSNAQASFPTWTFWGKTTVELYNTGNCTESVILMAGAASPDSIYLDAGENARTFGYWAGFPLWTQLITQQDTANNQIPEVEIWVW